MFDPKAHVISYSPAALRSRATAAARGTANVADRMRAAFHPLARTKLSVCPACGYSEEETSELQRAA